MPFAQVTIGERIYPLTKWVDISIPLDPHGPQPNAYGVPPATARPYSGEGFTLDTRQGGSCNCDVIELTPHCNGTHTESVGHLTTERFPLSKVTLPLFLPCALVSVTPEGREIRAEAIGRALANTPPEFLDALVVRTLPNDPNKVTRMWGNATTPYFAPDAMAVIRARNVRHLLVDLPSLDPLVDEGRLAAHRIFWSMPTGSKELPDAGACQRTVTEMIFVPDRVPDGRYALMIQVPPLVSDAAPSRPLLFDLDGAI
uniref:N-formylkynurenine (Aryl-) formamidase n=1 Tax=Gemmata sp. Wa1-1 TaxID=235140 RepID=Q6W755_9BACT|nr:N-formylkynurenine (aryl-) formamidase [Gemmata sp. Wa1-1]